MGVWECGHAPDSARSPRSLTPHTPLTPHIPLTPITSPPISEQLDALVYPLYDSLRPLVLQQASLEPLCEMVQVLLYLLWLYVL